MTDVLTHNQWGRNIMANVSQPTSHSQQQQKQQIYQKNTRRALPRLKNDTSPRTADSRKITVFRNGDRYFPGKAINISPDNYANLGDFLQDLSTFVDLPYGVRRLFTPTKGSEVTDVNIIKDGASYVCASFEPFQKLEYSSIPVPRLTFNIEQFRQPLHESPSSHRSSFRHLPSIPNSKFGANNRAAFNNLAPQIVPPAGPAGNATQRKTFGKTNKYTFDLSHHKPRTITIIKQGNEKPHKTITILLNRRTTQSYEQLLSDISEAFGYQKNRQDKVRRLFTLKGKQVNGLNDLFREEDIFVASTNLSDIAHTDLQEINIEILNENNSVSRGSMIPRATVKGQIHSPVDRDTPNTQPGLAIGSIPIDLKKIGSVRDSGFLDDEDILSSRGSELTTARKTPSKLVNGNMKAYETVSEDAPTPNDLISRKMKRAPFKTNNIFTIDQQRERERQRLREEDERRKKIFMRKDPQNAVPAPIPKFEPLVLSVNLDDSHPTKSKTPTGMAQIGTTRPFSPHFSTPAGQTGKTTTKPSSTTPLPRINIPIIADENVPNNHENDNTTTLTSFPGAATKKFHIKKRSIALHPSSTVVTEKYEFGKKMGDGNFAVVHRSKLRGTEREYAIKIIEKKKMKGKEYMLDHEINIMYMCNHPNIIRLFEDYETPDEIYLVMELIKGGDLFDYITKHRRFDEPTASLMIKDVAEALLYLHAKKIVHRDLKPENLLVMQRKDGRTTIKLTDFGLAMQVTGPIKTVCGTPTYVAPEILAEIGYGIEVDCWATGIILYILLCGYPPFKTVDRKQEELFQLIQRGKFAYEPEHWGSISATAKDLIDHLLVVDRHKRMRSDEILLHQWILTLGQSKTVRNLDDTKILLRGKYEAKAKEYAAESTGP